jgi:predicted ferric reductase
MTYVYIISLIPAVLWTIAYWPVSDRLSDSFGFFLSIGQVSGLIGLSLYSISLILSTRPKFLENLFDGLNQIYKKHHLIGGLSFIFMMVHPIFLIFYRLSISFEYARSLIIPG